MAGATEQNEEKFKEFINSLLEAQSYDFMNEKALFTRKTLEKTLTTFCDIIARELECDSCEILMQIYDPKMVNEKYLKELMDEYLEKVSKPYAEKEKAEFEKNRKYLLNIPLNFPYWAFPKGAASLVAVNSNSPWLPVISDKTSRLNYTPLKSGITKEIFQEDVARIRDKLSIIETRNFIKLGYADPLVWNNTGWKYVFKNYYGVPIRIHTGGEVIGLLKVENKKESKEEEIKNLLSMSDSVALAESIINKLKDASQKLENFKSLDVSLLALAYLEADLKSLECRDSIKKNGGGLEKLFFIPYPDYITEILKTFGDAIIKGGILKPRNEAEENSIKDDPINSLRAALKKGRVDLKKIFQERKLLCDIFISIIQTFPIFEKLKCDELKSSKTDEKTFKSKAIAILDIFDSKIRQFDGININSLIPIDDKTRPPMQLFTKSIAEERRLWNLLGNENSWGQLYENVKKFYNIFYKAFSSIDYREAACDLQAVEKILIESVANSTFANGPLKECRFEIEDWINGEPIDFHFKVSLLQIKNETEFLDIYVVILPDRNEFKDALIDKYTYISNKYKQSNLIWLNKDGDRDITVENHRRYRQGFSEKTVGELIYVENSGWITDFLMDRLAARMQAFTLAFPVAEFSFSDTNKLTWAAFEIGKLIEREISYRANRHDDPMPLTAMEFYRVPISDLSFVDDMRARRNNLKKSAPNIDVYLKNIIFEMNMANAVEYSSRIKGYRSYFQRIGERFEGYVRGNIALWVFLLSLIAENDEAAFLKNEKLQGDGNVFLDNLSIFREYIKESLDEPEFFDKLCRHKFPDYYGDLKFDSPPFMDEKKWNNSNPGKDGNLIDLLLKAFMRIRDNLTQEGVNITGLKGIEDSELKTKSLAEISKLFKEKLDISDDLLLRDYSFFKRDALSLMIQIANLLNNIDVENAFNDFKKFYKNCRELREFLCSSPQEIDDGKKEYHLRKIFGMEKNKEKGDKKEAWKEIKDFINKYNTGDVFGKKTDSYLLLTARSIYKRIRMLHNILRHQIPSAFLDWELSRFDLYGARMNCLYKNQVFALFEKIWNKGDTFFFYEPSVEKLADYCPKKGKKIDTNRFRQRWLCLRVNLMEGEYNACQIATLIDPKTVEPAYWENISSYNLKSLQYVLGKIFSEFEEEAAKKYRCYSWHRRLISDSYCNWYKYSANIFQNEIGNGQQESKKNKWFGSFLFEGVINILLFMLSSFIDFKTGKADKNRLGFHKDTIMVIAIELQNIDNNDFFEIVKSIRWIVESGVTYSNKIKKYFMKERVFSKIPFECKCGKNIGSKSKEKTEKLFVCRCPSKKTNNVCGLYAQAIKFLDNIIQKINKKKSIESDIDILKKIKNDLEKEREFFSKLEKTSDTKKGFQIPLFYFDDKQSGSNSQKTIKDIRKISKMRIGNREKNVEFWVFIYRTLKRIRREQRSYLFDIGDKSQKKYAGLWMRDKNEILGRIKNYALLFSKEVIDKENEEHFRGWNAHDLYYYIHSLIPMEIQVRTELTNTFAVQYHDSIYKLHPPAGTEFPNSMIKTAGEGLDKIDREMEIDYEDYTLRYRHRSEEGDL